jgi:hypothetical protein
MDILVSGTTITNSIQTAPIPNAQPVQLVQGQLIKTLVQRVVDSTVWLEVGGKTLVARTEVPLQAQQQVWLEVIQADPAEVILRLIEQPSQSQPENPSNAPSLSTKLATMLTSWGMDADEANLIIAKTLMAHSGTVRAEDVEAVRTLWRTIPDAHLDDLRAATLLYAKQLPINRESLTLTDHGLNQMPQIARQLSELETVMHAAYMQLEPAFGKAPTYQQLLNTLESALTQIANWTVSTDLPRAEIAARLAKLIPNLGTPPEAKLANYTWPSNQMGGQFILTNGGGGKDASPTVIMEAGVSVEAGGLPSPISNQTALPTALPPKIIEEIANPFHRLTAIVHSVLAETDLDGVTTQTLHRLADKLEMVSKDLGALQLTNVANLSDSPWDPHFLFPIPLNTPQGPHIAQLKVYRRLGQDSVDPENMRLALLLDLPELGEIAVNLTVFERRLGGQILSEREQTHQLVEAGLKELYHSLLDLGYRVDSLTSGLLSDEGESILTVDSDADLMDIPLPQINLRA